MRSASSILRRFADGSPMQAMASSRRTPMERVETFTADTIA